MFNDGRLFNGERVARSGEGGSGERLKFND